MLGNADAKAAAGYMILTQARRWRDAVSGRGRPYARLERALGGQLLPPQRAETAKFSQPRWSEENIQDR